VPFGWAKEVLQEIVITLCRPASGQSRWFAEMRLHQPTTALSRGNEHGCAL